MIKKANSATAKGIFFRIGALMAVMTFGIAYANAQGTNLITNPTFSVTGSTLSTNDSYIQANQPGTGLNIGAGAGTLPGWTDTSNTPTSSAASPSSTGIACVMIKGNSGNPVCGQNGVGFEGGGAKPLTYYPGDAPGGGNILAADGDSLYQSIISQTINGLVAGSKYTLTFYQAASPAGINVATTDQWTVTLGSQSQTAALMTTTTSAGSPWSLQTLIFSVPTGVTSETLSFLANGGPAGDPPMALLANLSLTKTVPEPSTLTLIGAALAGLAWGQRKRVRRSV